jgi:hypothetical protein
MENIAEDPCCLSEDEVFRRRLVMLEIHSIADRFSPLCNRACTSYRSTGFICRLLSTSVVVQSYSEGGNKWLFHHIACKSRGHWWLVKSHKLQRNCPFSRWSLGLKLRSASSRETEWYADTLDSAFPGCSSVVAVPSELVVFIFETEAKCLIY